MQTPQSMSTPHHPESPVAGPLVSHDYSPPPRARRHLQVLTAAVLGTALLTSTALQLAQDERGLQVSLRAVADGHETPDAAAEIPPRLRR